MIEYIQAADGTAHVSSADDGALFSTIVGTGEYVGGGLAEGFALTIKDNNHLVLGTGAGWHNGRGFRVVSNEEVTIQSGTQGQRRIDLIVSRYTSDGSVERGAVVVIKGEPVPDTEKPSVPAHEDGNILDSVAVSDFPLYAVRLNGLQIESTERLFDKVPSLADVKGLIAGLEAKNAAQDAAIDGKATKKHTHAAADIASGALAVSRGGTGAQSAGPARANLGMGKRLWSGLHKGGNLTVPGLQDYRSFNVVVNNGVGNLSGRINVPVFRRNGAPETLEFEGYAPYFSANRDISTLWVGATVSGDVLMDLSVQQIIVATNGWAVTVRVNDVLEIWGVA